VDVRGLRVHEAEAAVEERLRGANGPARMAGRRALRGAGERRRAGRWRHGLHRDLGAVSGSPRSDRRVAGPSQSRSAAFLHPGLPWSAGPGPPAAGRRSIAPPASACRTTRCSAPMLSWWPSIAGRFSAPSSAAVSLPSAPSGGGAGEHWCKPQRRRPSRSHRPAPENGRLPEQRRPARLAVDSGGAGGGDLGTAGRFPRLAAADRSGQLPRW